MSVNLSQKKLLLSRLSPILTKDDGELIKSTVRLSNRQMAFITEMQEVLPGKPSLQDCITFALDLLMMETFEPAGHAINADNSFLSILKQHNLHEIHVNPLLSLLGLPEVGLRVTNNEAQFAAALDIQSKEVLQKLFGISTGYMEGAQVMPHDIIPLVHPDQSEGLATPEFESLQPASSVLFMSCPDMKCGTTLIVQQTEYALNPTKSFIVYYPLGCFSTSTDNGKAIDKAFKDKAKALQFRCFHVQVQIPYFRQVIQGDFLTEPGAILPGRFRSAA